MTTERDEEIQEAKVKMFDGLKLMTSTLTDAQIGSYFRDMLSPEVETSLFTEDEEYIPAYTALVHEILAHNRR